MPTAPLPTRALRRLEAAGRSRQGRGGGERRALHSAGGCREAPEPGPAATVQKTAPPGQRP
eukprot:3619913-Alexandrium_andersonii.AAC.1